MIKFLLPALLVVSQSLNACEEGCTENEFKPKNIFQTYTDQHPPVVAIDSAHNNAHTMNAGYLQFAKLLESDGLVVKDNSAKFSKESLQSIDVLVIANAQHEKNVGFENWGLPNFGAFERTEIESVHNWVKEGGALFLIADHMPFPKASEELAAVFGFQFNNGYARLGSTGGIVFKVTDGGIKEHPVQKGLRANESIEMVRSYSGQAFLIPPNAQSILTLGEGTVSYMPAVPREFEESTPQLDVRGWSQGAVMEFGKGRIYVSGEAFMFTGPYNPKTKKWWPIGIAHEEAKQNEQFILNIVHWLTRKI